MKRLALFALLGVAACDPHRSSAEATTPAGPRPEGPSDFVVFTERHVVIERLEIPFDAPTTVGSSASFETLASDDPSVVSVDASGRLVAHREGKTTVRARGTGSELTVEVRTAPRSAHSRNGGHHEG